MTIKGQPPKDAKTVAVGSAQKNPAASRPKPADDDRTKLVTEVQGGRSDEGKTTLVRMDNQAATGPQGGRPSQPQAAIRPGPSPRLPWPARDQQRLTGAGSQSDEDVAIPPASKNDQADDEQPTRLFSPGSGAAPSKPSSAPSEPSSAMREDPVVGWLVIVQGPGQGNSVEIGIGANSIGRDPGQKICLDYGDQQIHREKHAVVVYEPRTRRFYLQSGDVRNLTYLGDELVLNPAELKGGETIVLGQTHMRFVPFCGPDFGWS